MCFVLWILFFSSEHQYLIAIASFEQCFEVFSSKFVGNLDALHIIHPIFIATINVKPAFRFYALIALQDLYAQLQIGFLSLVDLRFLYSSTQLEPGVFLIRHIHHSSIDPATSFRTVLSVHLARSL